MEINFNGKRALVTGAASGIGREISIMLARNGAKVIAADRSAADLDKLKKEIDCEVVVADLSDAAGARAAAQKAGAVDLLVNNVGISILQPFLETTADAWDKTMAINARAAMIIGQVVAKGMVDRKKGGAIVNISSQASKVGLVDHTTYCASKGAIDQLTRVMAVELGKHNIRVNAVNPTVTLTPMGEMAWSDPAKAGPMLAKIPLGRFAKPAEIASVVLFLLSDLASMVHGATLPVDGGFLAT